MKVITLVNLKIMEEITKDLTKKWSINRLSKTMNKHYRPVYAAVQALIDQGFLIKNQNNLIEPAFNNPFLLELAEGVVECRLNEIVLILNQKSLIYKCLN